MEHEAPGTLKIKEKSVHYEKGYAGLWHKT